MSEANLRIVRAAFDRFGTSEQRWEDWDEDVVVTPPAGWPEGSAVSGLDAWRRQLDRLRDSWEDACIEIDEMRPVGEDRVVTAFRYVTRGRGGSLEFDTRMGAIHTFKQRKIVRADFFRSADDAFKAAGLSE
jgi:ketosteroid isomerase-like protein